MTDLDLGLIGNCSFAAMVDGNGRIVWCCLPRFDGDPVFSALLSERNDDSSDGVFAIELAGMKASEQAYEPNTAVLKTRLNGETGSIEIVDFAPRFPWRDRMFRPLSIVRRVTPLSGSPRIRIRLRPHFSYGSVAATGTTDSAGYAMPCSSSVRSTASAQ